MIETMGEVLSCVRQCFGRERDRTAVPNPFPPPRRPPPEPVKIYRILEPLDIRY